MHVRTDLQYTYEPPDFFEADLVVQNSSGTLQATEGSAILTLAQPAEVKHERAKLLTEEVRAIFHTRQLLVHKTFTLRGPEVVHYRPDGKRDYVMLVEPAHLKLSALPVDFRVTNAAGEVISDSRAERIAEHKGFISALTEKVPTSPTLRKMLASYNAAVNDPANELVHLYEIRDTLVDHFEGAKAAQHALEVDTTTWECIGHLANGAPIQEGRHRGRQESLRPATKDELEAARDSARVLLQRFAMTLKQ